MYADTNFILLKLIFPFGLKINLVNKGINFIRKFIRNMNLKFEKLRKLIYYNFISNLFDYIFYSFNAKFLYTKF